MSSWTERRNLGGGNVPDVGSEKKPVVSPYGLPAYRKNGFWYFQGYSMSGDGSRVWSRVTDPKSQQEYDKMYDKPNRKPLKNMTKSELKQLRVILHVLPDGTLDIKEKGADSLERSVADWMPPNRPDMTERSRVGGFIGGEMVADDAKSWLDEVSRRYDLDMDEIVSDSWRGGGMRHKASPYKFTTNIVTGKVKRVDKSDTITSDKSSLQSIHASRSERSRSSDENQEHSLIIEPDDPRVEQWKRDQGRMDVRGIDTPTGSGRKHKVKSPPKRRPNSMLGGMR